MEWRNKVIKLMEIKKMNQKELSEKSGITEASISRYLNGERTPRTDIIINFAKALEVNVEYLLEDDPQMTHSPYNNIATAIARDGSELSPEEMTKLIELILARGKNVQK